LVADNVVLVNTGIRYSHPVAEIFGIIAKARLRGLSAGRFQQRFFPWVDRWFDEEAMLNFSTSYEY
jgi:hypothetical protein